MIRSKGQPSTYQLLIKNFMIMIMMMMMMLRSHQAMTRNPCEYHISKTTEENFPQFWSQMYVGS